jgi:hypothetical protein
MRIEKPRQLLEQLTGPSENPAIAHGKFPTKPL